jgi:putative heme-binding domain-containing protein
MFLRNHRGFGLAVLGAGLAVLAAGFWLRSRAEIPASSSPGPDAHRASLRAFVLANPQSGSAEAGRKLFFDRNLLSCLSCHQVHGKGSKFGPDLSSVGARATLAYLVDSVLDPSKDIVPGYQRVTVTTRAGRTVRGVLKVKTERHIEVKVGGRLERLQTNQIQRLELDPVSDMPEGTVDHLTAAQFADLIAYLGSLKGPRTTARNGH